MSGTSGGVATSGPTRQPRLSVVIPTYRRASSLERCLRSIAAQTHDPLEVIVVVRDDDHESLDVVQGQKSTVRRISVSRPGAVAALSAGWKNVCGDVIVITDDDTVPRPDWLERIYAHFATRPMLGALGGRDIVHINGDVLGGKRRRVGQVLWWGRWVGNHHLQSEAQEVHFLKGANMAIRRSAAVTLPANLRGQGAEVGWDLYATWAIHCRGWEVWYDPKVLVDHYPAERHDEDSRVTRSQRAESNEIYNSLYVVLRPARLVHWPTIAGYQLIVGTRQAPGVVLGMLTGSPRPERRRRLIVRLEAIRDAWRDRVIRDSRDSPAPNFH